MNNYFKIILENLNDTIERRTRLDENNLGNEAIYNTKQQLLFSTNNDIINDGEYLSEVLGGKLEVVMCGGGHIGNAVYQLAQLLDWKITIIEDREEFCNVNKYPNANLILGDYRKEILNLDLSNAAVIIATRGHKHDKSCLESALLKKTRYVGMIGSKSKVSATKKAIVEEINKQELLIDEALLDTIYSPIGLDINAQTPEEIAISIVSEIIKVTKGSKKQIELDVPLLKKLANEDKEFVVARIIEKNGSAPREEGSFLAMFKNGEVQGTIGGGAVEAQVIKDCKNLLLDNDKKTQLYYHNLSNTKASQLGMICGGNVKVLITKFTS